MNFWNWFQEKEKKKALRMVVGDESLSFLCELIGNCVK